MLPKVRNISLAMGVACVCVAFLMSPVQATPIPDDTSTGVAKWKVPVHVYIPLDPTRNDPDPTKRRNRHNKVKDAVDKWVAAAQANGVQVSATVLDANGNIPGTNKKPDTNTEGTVVVQWVDTKTGEANYHYSGELTGEKVLKGPNKDKDILRNQFLTDVTIQIEKARHGTEAYDDQQAFAVMMHEFGHSLMIDHSKQKDSVMQKMIESYVDKTKPGASDVRELNSIYQAQAGNLQGMVQPTGDGDYRYTYTATWLTGGELPLVQLLTLGAPTADITLPPGWEYIDFDDADPWPNIFTLRVAPTDDLQAYLNALNPTMEFAFTSPYAPQETIGWLGDDQMVMAPVVPLPPSFAIGLTLMTVACLQHHTHEKHWRKHRVGQNGM